MSSNASTYDQYFVGTTASADLLGEQQKYKKDTSGAIVVAQNNDEWHHSTIIIYDNVMDNKSMSTQERIGNATHEIGHSLKLAHPGEGTERVRSVPSGKVAIMQQGIAGYGPQEYDEVELKEKWGT